MSGRAGPRLRAIPLVWMGWATVMLAFQQWGVARIDLKRPDRVLAWTASETGANSQDDKPYLLDPFLNQHVSWDSEFYLSIATVGYDDPAVRAIPYDFARDPAHQRFCEAGRDPIVPLSSQPARSPACAAPWSHSANEGVRWS